MKRLSCLVAAAVLGASLLVVRASKAEPVLLDGVAGAVDERYILYSEVVARARPHLRRMPEAQRTPEGIRHLYDAVLREMIDGLLVARAAESASIGVDDAEIDAAMKVIRERSGVTQEALESEVARSGLTMDEYRARLREQVLEGKWMQRVVLRRRPLPTPTGATEEERQKAFGELYAAERNKAIEALKADAYLLLVAF